MKKKIKKAWLFDYTDEWGVEKGADPRIAFKKPAKGELKNAHLYGIPVYEIKITYKKCIN